MRAQVHRDENWRQRNLQSVSACYLHLSVCLSLSQILFSVTLLLVSCRTGQTDRQTDRHTLAYCMFVHKLLVHNESRDGVCVYAYTDPSRRELTSINPTDGQCWLCLSVCLCLSVMCLSVFTLSYQRCCAREITSYARKHVSGSARVADVILARRCSWKDLDVAGRAARHGGRYRGCSW